MGTREQTGPIKGDRPAEETAEDDQPSGAGQALPDDQEVTTREQGPGSSEAAPGDEPLDLAIATGVSQRSANVRQAAKWALELHDWEALEDEVQEIIDTYDPPEGIALPIVDEFLAEAIIAGNAGLALITCPRTQEYHEQVRETWEALGPTWVKTFRERGDVIEIITHASRLEEGLDRLGPEATGYAPLSEILLCRPLDALSMLGPEPLGAPDLEATLELATDLLEEHGVTVHHARTSRRRAHLLVPSYQGVRAVAMIAALADDARSVGSEAGTSHVPGGGDNHEAKEGHT